TNLSGIPIPLATITVEQLQLNVSSDSSGNFSLSLPAGKYTFIFGAEGYQTIGQDISVGDKQPFLEVALPPKTLQFEEIVTAEEESGSASSVSAPSSTIKPENKQSPSSVLETVQDVPGVAALGQGGLFQVPSIRGAARERTLLLFDSVRITSERRTGPSFSFVDPLLMDSIEVFRGPAPVLYGSNGETGVIQAFSREPEAGISQTFLHTGYKSNSKENWQAVGYSDGKGNLNYVASFVRRESGDYETPDGQALPSQYKRYNLMAKARWFSANGTLTLLFLPSLTEDIDKTSTDFATRPTLYPRETHQIYFADWQNSLWNGAYDFQAQGWFHPSSLKTIDFRLENGALQERNEVLNETHDYGAHFRIGKTIEGWKLWTGLHLVGRADVDARQQTFEPSNGDLVLVDDFFSLKDARRKDVGIFLTGSGPLGKFLANAGVRLNRISMSNEAGDFAPATDYNWTAFLGVSYPLSFYLDAIFNVGRGVRPATLSEKFFTGETGRGSIAGNPNLLSESNLELDGGLRFHSSSARAGIYLFRNDISDYIERIRIEDDQFTFANQSGVTVWGIEGEAFVQWQQYLVYGNFHRIEGENELSDEV
ncbi:MAG TPA: TonB-dependent receptor, partial [Acidobacteriota bacterium]|nr:TonB-dependent receptor [Acidobacteriota bacterium]